MDRIALRFGPDLADPIEQNRRCSPATLRILRLRISQRWSEDEMQGVQIILASLLRWYSRGKRIWQPRSRVHIPTHIIDLNVIVEYVRDGGPVGPGEDGEIVVTHQRICFVFLFVWILFVHSNTCLALTPEEVVVVANKMAWHSCDLAKYYMKKREIPAENLIELKAPAGEHCSRDDYEAHIASPIRAFLKKSDPGGSRFRCLLIMYGIPLRVYPPKLTSEDQKRLSGLQKQQDVIREQISKAEREQNKKELTALKDAERQLKRQIEQVQKAFQGAAVDSELALVREKSYPLDYWVPNKYFVGYRGQKIENMPQNVIVVSRLDGPSEEIVRRMIDDSLHAEKEGLRGAAYFDARWPDPGDKKLTGYAFYDRAIHNAARVVEKSKRMPVVADSQEKLFQPGQCPDAAFYCGWHSLAHYVDAFTWARGAVGFHIASSECGTLKNKSSQAWCKVMIEKGVAATLGPVAEPYVQAFPPPDLFFGLLLDGRLTLAECYALSNPFWSWQMVLIGDPLYRPFKNSGAAH